MPARKFLAVGFTCILCPVDCLNRLYIDGNLDGAVHWGGTYCWVVYPWIPYPLVSLGAHILISIDLGWFVSIEPTSSLDCAIGNRFLWIMRQMFSLYNVVSVCLVSPYFPGRIRVLLTWVIVNIVLRVRLEMRLHSVVWSFTSTLLPFFVEYFCNSLGVTRLTRNSVSSYFVQSSTRKTTCHFIHSTLTHRSRCRSFHTHTTTCDRADYSVDHRHGIVTLPHRAYTAHMVLGPVSAMVVWSLSWRIWMWFYQRDQVFLFPIPSFCSITSCGLRPCQLAGPFLSKFCHSPFSIIISTMTRIRRLVSCILASLRGLKCGYPGRSVHAGFLHSTEPWYIVIGFLPDSIRLFGGKKTQS